MFIRFFSKFQKKLNQLSYNIKISYDVDDSLSLRSTSPDIDGVSNSNYTYSTLNTGGNSSLTSIDEQIIINGITYSNDMKKLISCNRDIVNGDIVIPEGVECIEADAFAWTFIRSVKLPSSLQVIGPRAFTHCYNLKYIDFGESEVKMLEEDTFKECLSIESLEIPKSVSEICTGCFENCDELKTVIFHEGIRNIKSNAFWPDMKIKKINIPNSIECIGRYNFANIQYVSSDGYVEGLATMCMETFGLTELKIKENTIYIPYITNNTNCSRFHYAISEIEKYMKNTREKFSYVDLIKSVEYDGIRIAHAMFIYEKTDNLEVFNFLKKNSDILLNVYLLRTEKVELLIKLINLDMFSEKQLMDILHTEICNSSIPLKAIVLDKLKKQSFESSKFNI